MALETVGLPIYMKRRTKTASSHVAIDAEDWLGGCDSNVVFRWISMDT